MDAGQPAVRGDAQFKETRRLTCAHRGLVHRPRMAHELRQPHVSSRLHQPPSLLCCRGSQLQEHRCRPHEAGGRPQTLRRCVRVPAKTRSPLFGTPSSGSFELRFDFLSRPASPSPAPSRHESTLEEKKTVKGPRVEGERNEVCRAQHVVVRGRSGKRNAKAPTQPGHRVTSPRSGTHPRQKSPQRRYRPPCLLPSPP